METEKERDYQDLYHFFDMEITMALTALHERDYEKVDDILSNAQLQGTDMFYVLAHGSIEAGQAFDAMVDRHCREVWPEDYEDQE